MQVKEENIGRAIGSADDFYEVIPGYLDKFKAIKNGAAKED